MAIDPGMAEEGEGAAPPSAGAAGAGGTSDAGAGAPPGPGAGAAAGAAPPLPPPDSPIADGRLGCAALQAGVGSVLRVRPRRADRGTGAGASAALGSDSHALQTCLRPARSLATEQQAQAGQAYCFTGSHARKLALKSMSGHPSVQRERKTLPATRSWLTERTLLAACLAVSPNLLHLWAPCWIDSTLSLHSQHTPRELQQVSAIEARLPNGCNKARGG